MPAVFFNKGLIEAANAAKNKNTNNTPSHTAGLMARERQQSSAEDPSHRQQHPVNPTSPCVVVMHTNGAAATQSTQGTYHSTQPQTQRLDHAAQSPLMPPSQPSELRTPGLGFAKLPTPSSTWPFLQSGRFSATPPGAVPCVPTTVVSRTPSGKPPLVPRPPVMVAGKTDVHPHPPARQHRTEEMPSLASKAKAVLLEERERSCTLTQNGGASPPKGRHLRRSTHGTVPANNQHSRASRRTGSTIGQSAALDARLLQPHRPPQPALLNRLKEEFAAVQALKRVRSVDTQSRVPISRATLAVWTLTAAIPTPTLTDSVETDRHNKRDTSTSTTTTGNNSAAPRHRGHVNDQSTKAPLKIAVHIPTEYPFVAPTIEVVRPARSTSSSSFEVRQVRENSNDDGAARKAPRWSPVSPNPQLICGGLFDGVEHRTPTSSCRGDVASRAASLDASANDHLTITKTLDDDDGDDQSGLGNGAQVRHSVSGHRAAAVARADNDDDDEDDARPPAPTAAVRGFEGEVMVTASVLPPPEFTSGAAAIQLDTDGLGAGDVFDRTTGRRRHDMHPLGMSGDIDGGWWHEHLQHHFVSVAPSYWTPAMSIAHYINAGLRAAGLPSLGLSRSSDRSLGSNAPDRRSAPHRAVFETVDFRSDVCGDWAEFEGFTSTDGDEMVGGEEMLPRSSSSFRRDGSMRSDSAKRSRSPDAVGEDHPSPLTSASWAPLGNELTSG